MLSVTFGFIRRASQRLLSGAAYSLDPLLATVLIGANERRRRSGLQSGCKGETISCLAWRTLCV